MAKIKQTRIDGHHKRTFPATVSCLGEHQMSGMMQFEIEVKPDSCPLWMKCLSGGNMKVTLEGNIEH